MTSVIDLRGIRQPSVGDLATLRSYVSQLEGQPYLFARVTYGEELNLHFGELQEFRSPKLRRREKGSYVLAVRGSAWCLHSFPEACLFLSGFSPAEAQPAPATNGRSQDLEKLTLFEPGARVLAADIFTAHPHWGIELSLTLSDGSTFHIIPLT